MKKLLLLLFALFAWSALKAADTDSTSVQKKSSYELFVSKSGIKSAGECLRIYKDGDKYWMEFPDSVMGRRVILSSFMRSSSGWTTCGTDISSKEVFALSKTDSLLVLSSPLVLPESSDSLLRESLTKFAVAPVRYAFPIKYRGADGSSVIVDVTKLFSTSNKDAFNPKRVQIDGDAFVNKATPKAEFTVFQDFVSFPYSTGIVQRVTFTAAPAYNVGSGMLQVVEEEIMTVEGDVATVLTLIPENTCKVRAADDRIGTVNSSRNVFSGEKGIKEEKILSRWDISDGKKIVVYVDTLFSPVQQEAVSRGLLAWNKTFEAAGLGEVIEVLPYGTDKEFSAENPLTSKIMADVHSSAGRLVQSVLSDPSTGQVLAFSITVPAGLRGTLGQQGFFGIADVDERWRNYEIPEDAFCEALTAKVMQAFARALGLDANSAGSFAYSPAQLRDPEFTRQYGITASVTDDVLFNTLARPSDKEKGVVTIVEQPGVYDYMAIEWIYAHPDAASDKALADSIINSKNGNPAYLFIPASKDSPDPRCYAGDLGNDPFEEFSNAIRRLKEISAGVPSWYETTVPQNTLFRTVLVEQILLHHQAEHRKLARLVGGLYVHDLASGKKYEAVDKASQKKAMTLAVRGLSDIDYLDSNKELLSFSGAYSGFTALMRVNSVNLPGITQRLKWVATAQKLGVGTYNLQELMSDVTDEVTVNLRKGKLPEGEEFKVGVWMSLGLMNNVPSYRQTYAEYTHKNALLSAPITLSEEFYGPLLERASAAELERLSRILQKCSRAARNDYDRDRIGYLLSQMKGINVLRTQP